MILCFQVNNNLSLKYADLFYLFNTLRTRIATLSVFYLLKCQNHHGSFQMLGGQCPPLLLKFSREIQLETSSHTKLNISIVVKGNKVINQ
jgi:hypothetical protein